MTLTTPLGNTIDPAELVTVTPSYLEARLSAISPSDIITRTELQEAIASIPTAQDVALAAAAVDAKFDMLRSAISEATDYYTLKARLLAVLQ